MMMARVKELVREGFKITGKGLGAVYVEKGADSRVVLNSGMVKRGKPDYRADRVNKK